MLVVDDEDDLDFEKELDLEDEGNFLLLLPNRMLVIEDRLHFDSVVLGVSLIRYVVPCLAQTLAMNTRVRSPLLTLSMQWTRSHTHTIFSTS